MLILLLSPLLSLLFSQKDRNEQMLINIIDVIFKLLTKLITKLVKTLT